MATRGARPKPAALRLVDGTHNVTRHGKAEDAKAAVDAAFNASGPLKPPSGMKGEALKAWKRFIVPAAWIDGFREPAAIAFCELWAQHQKCPEMFVAAKHGQMRAYMAELGLTDERNRGKVSEGPKDEFFDD